MQNEKRKILIVEDSESLALTAAHDIALQGWQSRCAFDLAQARAALLSETFDAVLLDLSLPDGEGLSLLEEKVVQMPPVIVLTADGGADSAMRAIRAGAEDYVVKPASAGRLTLTLKRVFEKSDLRRDLSACLPGGAGSFCGFIGRAPAMRAVYAVIAHAAASRAPVFITGESGTGKELAAAALHALSPRKEKAFEAVNCAAIPVTLLESEIYGHVRGAFTGAVQAHKGAAERADGGTMFLDEIGEMPMELQAKMLRFIQTGHFRPVGAAKEAQADVRFISATNRDPAVAVAEGFLREDLFYRLGVVPLHMPPLRARGDDILLLASEFLRAAAEEEGKRLCAVSPSAADWLMSHAWPGNVRQLQNVIRRAVVMNDGDVLTVEMLTDEGQRQAPLQAVSKTVPDFAHDAAIEPLEDTERAAINRAIDLCGGNVQEAARRLGVNPSTIHRKRLRWRQVSS